MVFKPRKRKSDETRAQWKRSKRSHHKRPVHLAHWNGRTFTQTVRNRKYGT